MCLSYSAVKKPCICFATFLRDEPVDQLEGIIPFTREQMQQIERRGEERITVQDPQRYLSHRHSDLVLKAEIIDMNFFWGIAGIGTWINRSGSRIST